MRKWIGIACVAVLAMTLSTYRLNAADQEHAQSVFVSKQVVVTLRGDACGIAWHDRLPDPSRLAQVRGTLISEQPEGFILTRDGKPVWISKSAVVLMEQVSP